MANIFSTPPFTDIVLTGQFRWSSHLILITHIQNVKYGKHIFKYEKGRKSENHRIHNKNIEIY